METVNKYVSAASTAIWGENGSSSTQQNLQHGEEPIAGVQGKGGATDPYDAGNREGKLYKPLSSLPQNQPRNPTSGDLYPHFPMFTTPHLDLYKPH
jgi:hypothetical protein